MKTIKYISLAVIVAVCVFTTSCKKYLDDVAVNPNDPEAASPKLLLANVEVATFASYTGNNARRAGILTQHLSGTGFQMQDAANYLILESDVTNDWITIYTGALVNAQIIIDKYGAANPHYAGIAKVLKAMNLGLATDMWGDIPNKDALGGQANLNAKYESQETILTDIQAILDEAILNLKEPLAANQLFPGAEDYIYGGDVNSWIGMAYVLKARYANRLSDRSPAQSATDAISYLNLAYAAGFSSNAADAEAKFGASGSDGNQWYVFNNTRGGYIKMGKFFIDTMAGAADPRLPFYADTLDGGIYAGGETSNASADNSSDIGVYCDDEIASMPLVSFVEAKFIEAECKLRSGDAAGAAIAHNEAVKASILRVTGASDLVYEAAHAAETAISISLPKIMMEKYTGLFTQIETWTDWRRTGFPGLAPNPSGAVAGIPRRLPTPLEERNYNTNAIVVGNILTPVWFDVP